MASRRDHVTWSRRQLLAGGALLGASVACATSRPVPSRFEGRERRDLFAEGVASGDPTFDSVILWTRRAWEGGGEHRLHVEIAEDEAFRKVVASEPAIVSAASDWTTRVLVTGLRPARVHFYRFIDESGSFSRIGRTITAPAEDDPRPVRFVFVSC